MTNRSLIHWLLNFPMDDAVIFQTGPKLTDREMILNITRLDDLKLIKLHGDYQEKLVAQFCSLFPGTSPELATNYLNAEDWNIEQAVLRFHRS